MDPYSDPLWRAIQDLIADDEYVPGLILPLSENGAAAVQHYATLAGVSAQDLRSALAGAGGGAGGARLDRLDAILASHHDWIDDPDDPEQAVYRPVALAPGSDDRARAIARWLLDTAMDRAALAGAEAIVEGARQGETRKKVGAQNRADIARHYALWEASDDLQDTYETPTAYIRTRVALSEKTIRRHLETLKVTP